MGRQNSDLQGQVGAVAGGIGHQFMGAQKLLPT